MTTNEWISTAEAAQILGLAPATVSRWAAKYDHTFARRIGRNYKLNRLEVLRIFRDGTMPPLRDTSATQDAEAPENDRRQEPLFR